MVAQSVEEAERKKLDVLTPPLHCEKMNQREGRAAVIHPFEFSESGAERLADVGDVAAAL